MSPDHASLVGVVIGAACVGGMWRLVHKARQTQALDDYLAQNS